MQTNEKPQHTPGPWEISGSLIVRKETAISSVLHSSHTGTENEKRKCRDYDRFAPKWTGEAEANARLIAAAPELLAALAAVVGIADRHPDLTVADLTVALDRARAAIANATGAA